MYWLVLWFRFWFISECVSASASTSASSALPVVVGRGGRRGVLPSSTSASSALPVVVGRGFDTAYTRIAITRTFTTTTTLTVPSNTGIDIMIVRAILVFFLKFFLFFLPIYHFLCYRLALSLLTGTRQRLLLPFLTTTTTLVTQRSSSIRKRCGSTDTAIIQSFQKL